MEKLFNVPNFDFKRDKNSVFQLRIWRHDIKLRLRSNKMTDFPELTVKSSLMGYMGLYKIGRLYGVEILLHKNVKNHCH